MKRAIVIMGVSGVGKSTIGIALATQLKIPFIEGDDYHPLANIDKMKIGVALQDEDRWPWLAALATEVNLRSDSVVSCSALKNSYREFLTEHISNTIYWIHLTLTKSELMIRMQNRAGHFMPAKLLDSQISTLEVPSKGKILELTNEGSPQEIVSKIIAFLNPPVGLTDKKK